MTRRVFDNLEIRSNHIIARPLLRSPESYSATIVNNTLMNVSDAVKLKNNKTGRPIGLEKPLRFECGVHGEFTVDGWKAGPTKK